MFIATMDKYASKKRFFFIKIRNVHNTYIITSMMAMLRALVRKTT